MEVFARDVAVHVLNKTQSSKEDRIFVRRQDTSTPMLFTALPRRLQVAKDQWVRSPDTQKDDRWTHGQVNRSQGTPEQDKV